MNPNILWWLPIIGVLTLAGFLLLLQQLGSARSVNLAKVYRRRYLELVTKLEQTVALANQVAPKITPVVDEKALDYLGSCLRLLETILETARSFKPFHDDPGVLSSAIYLTDDCRARLQRAAHVTAQSSAGQPIKPEALYGKLPVLVPRGCFFCSRPAGLAELQQVRVKLDDGVKQVWGCPECRTELQSNKKIKVLYFMKNERPVHWSEVSEYDPMRDFATLQQPATSGIRKVKLELVYSQPKPD